MVVCNNGWSVQDVSFSKTICRKDSVDLCKSISEKVRPPQVIVPVRSLQKIVAHGQARWESLAETRSLRHGGCPFFFPTHLQGAQGMSRVIANIIVGFRRFSSSSSQHSSSSFFSLASVSASCSHMTLWRMLGITRDRLRARFPPRSRAHFCMHDWNICMFVQNDGARVLRHKIKKVHTKNMQPKNGQKVHF